MLQVSEREVKNRLALDNPWWESGGDVDKRFRDMPRRDYFEAFYRLVSQREVNRSVVLMGPWRVGKTVLIQHAVHRLIANGVAGNRILYVSVEAPVYTGLSLEQLLGLFIAQFKHERSSTLFVFFDEIQYLKGWEVHLKDLVDAYPSYRFTASGSAAAALRLKSRESGAGRFTDFMLPPLTFAEYLRFVDRESELIDRGDSGSFKSRDLGELNQEFISYLNYGGYPEAVFSDAVRADTTRFIRSDIIDKVLLRDLPSLYGIQDIPELNKLFSVIAYNTAQEINLEALSRSAGVAKNTIRRYLEYLEAAFLVKRIARVDQSCKRFKRERFFKVYLTNPSMRAALFGNVIAGSEALGSLAETAVFSQWLHSRLIDSIYYARWSQGEVDIVHVESETARWAVEVKWSDRPAAHISELKHLLAFAEWNHLDAATVTTRTVRATQTIRSVRVELIPTSLYAYAVGKDPTAALEDRKQLG